MEDLRYLKIFRLLAPWAFRPPTSPTYYKLSRTSRGRPRSRTRATATRRERGIARERERIEGLSLASLSTSDPSLRLAIVCAIIKLFADDVKLYCPVAYAADLQTTLDTLCCWSDEWQLRVSVPKCFVLPIGPVAQADTTAFRIGSNVLEKVSHYVDLGVTVTTSLSTSCHCSKTVQVFSHKECRCTCESICFLRSARTRILFTCLEPLFS